MAFAATLIITLINVVLVFVLSVIGSGATDSFWIGLQIGLAWVAIFCSLALVKCTRGHGQLGVGIAVLTVPAGLVVVAMAGEIWSMREVSLRELEATPNVVAETCRIAGAQYLVSPTVPVHSIAFDWETEPTWARMSYINSDPRKFGGFRFLENIKYPESIRFIEQRERRVLLSEMQWPYKRKPVGGVYANISELTADALVTYDYRKLSKADARNSYVLTDIAVTDRRNGMVLATLRYVTGGKSSWPICGETSPGEINIAEFVFKALGTPSK